MTFSIETGYKIWTNPWIWNCMGISQNNKKSTAMSFIWRPSRLAMGGSIFSTITKNIWEASKKNASTTKIFVTVRIRLSFKWRQMENSTSWTTITGISQGRSAVGLKKWAALLEIKWRTQVRVWGEWHQLEASRKWCLWIIRGNLAHIWFPVRKRNQNDIFYHNFSLCDDHPPVSKHYEGIIIKYSTKIKIFSQGIISQVSINTRFYAN